LSRKVRIALAVFIRKSYELFWKIFSDLVYKDILYIRPGSESLTKCAESETRVAKENNHSLHPDLFGPELSENDWIPQQKDMFTPLRYRYYAHPEFDSGMWNDSVDMTLRSEYTKRIERLLQAWHPLSRWMGTVSAKIPWSVKSPGHWIWSECQGGGIYGLEYSTRWH